LFPGVLLRKTPKAEAEGFRPRKGLKRYPFDWLARQKIQAESPVSGPGPEMRPKFLHLYPGFDGGLLYSTGCFVLKLDEK
jgi:hypothetical protein